MNAEQLKNILDAHAAWLRGEKDGKRANLSYSNLSGSDLRGSDLSYSNLSDSNLRGSNLDLINNKSHRLAVARTRILPEGSIIGWKKCENDVIVKLRIPENARRCHAFGRKCRAEFAEVIEVIGADVGVSQHRKTEYRKGDIVRPSSFDTEWMNEYSGGIHFYITRTEAENH